MALNHAKFEFNENQTSSETEVNLNSREIGLLHGVVDKPGAEFDVVLEDSRGAEQVRKTFKAGNNRFGERIDLQLTDNCYIMKVENVKGAGSIDIFLE